MITGHAHGMWADSTNRLFYALRLLLVEEGQQVGMALLVRLAHRQLLVVRDATVPLAVDPNRRAARGTASARSATFMMASLSPGTSSSALAVMTART